MAEYEEYYKLPITDQTSKIDRLVIDLSKEIYILRSMIWLMHGHKGIYGDDGEMQCGECATEYGFYDWKRTDINEIVNNIEAANLRKLSEKETE